MGVKTTEEIKFCLTTAGLLADAVAAAQSYDYGGLKYITRTALGLTVAASGWLTFGVLDNLARDLAGRDRHCRSHMEGS